MSSYLKNILRKPDPEDNKKDKNAVKLLPSWLSTVQTSRPVTYDTSEMYEDKGDEMERKRQLQQQIYSKKCYDCSEFGHIAKECPNKWKKKLGGRFKDSDWCCSMCGNINWDWRMHCNKCCTPKPSGSQAEKRTGKGGGYNEIDDETLARIKARKKRKIEQTDNPNDNINNVNNNKDFYKNDSSNSDINEEKKPKKKRKHNETNNNGNNNNNTKQNIEKREIKKQKLNVSESEGNPTIYISNLNIDEISVDQLVKLFGQIGRIKKDRKNNYAIKLYRNKDGDLNGDGTLTYEDAYTAPFAVQWFDKTSFLDKIINVELAKNSRKKSYFNANEKDSHHNEYEYDDEDDINEDSGEDENDENEDDDIEAELFGYTRRGRKSRNYSNMGSRNGKHYKHSKQE